MPYNQQQPTEKPDMKFFYACFVSLVTTSFGFILRALILPEWGREFNLTQTQLGEIAGVGLWPFAIRDKIGQIKSAQSPSWRYDHFPNAISA